MKLSSEVSVAAAADALKEVNKTAAPKAKPEIKLLEEPFSKVENIMITTPTIELDPNVYLF